MQQEFGIEKFCWWVGELLGVDVLLGIRLLGVVLLGVVQVGVRLVGVVLLGVMLHGVELGGNVVLVECGQCAA